MESRSFVEAGKAGRRQSIESNKNKKRARAWNGKGREDEEEEEVKEEEEDTSTSTLSRGGQKTDDSQITKCAAFAFCCRARKQMFASRVTRLTLQIDSKNSPFLRIPAPN